MLSGLSMRTLLGIWTYLAFTVVSAIGFLLVGAVFLVIWPFDKNRRFTGRAIHNVGVLMIRSVPAWRFRVVGPLPAALPDRCVCVSNHCSNLDPFILAHLPWEMKFLAKSVLFRIPFVGWGITIAGDIPLVRGSSSSIKNAMVRCATYVRGGMPVLIFPEGTRSTTNEMLPFKDGAFRLAIQERADILPLAVVGTETALRKHDWRPVAARGLVGAGTPISTEGMTLSDVPRLKELVRAEIEAVRARLRPQLSERSEVAAALPGSLAG
jgi:1-acyl-sn-glycerol-3-phosphate acyltransferase